MLSTYAFQAIRDTLNAMHTPTGTGYAIGIAVGIAIGIALGNVGIGVAIGLVFGVIFEKARHRNKD